MSKEIQCPDCGAELKSCCTAHILDGQPEPEDSELQKLLKKNAYGMGLTTREKKRAWGLISSPELSEEPCYVCKKEKAIFDTGLCQGHARYALATRK